MKLTTAAKNQNWMILLYGEPDVGKTTAACHAEKPLVIDLEDGLRNIGNGVIPRNEDPITTIDQFNEMLQIAHDGDYKTLIIDSTTQLEKLLHKPALEACNKSMNKNYKDIAEPGYAKGYEFLITEWAKVVDGLRWVRDSGKNVILIGHTAIFTTNDPTMDSYDKIGPSIHKKSVMNVVSLMDGVFFAKIEVNTMERDDNKNKRRGFGTGKRFVYTSGDPSFIAKNRFTDLPQQIEMNIDTNIWPHLKFKGEI